MMHQATRRLRLRRIDPTLLLAFLLPVFAWAQLTYPGYFVFRSGFLPIFNLTNRLAHLGDLAWAPAVGTNYSLTGGDGPLPYLIAALPSALGASRVDAIKLVLGLSLILASAGAYFWTRRRTGLSWPALVASILYVFNPITLRLVYTDGAFAQVVLIAMMPWTLWAADVVLSGRLRVAIVLALLSAAAIWTQAGLALVFLLAVLVYVVALRQARRADAQALVAAAAGLAAGLLLGGLGWLPSILRHGVGVSYWPASGWLTLVAPWIAVTGAWIAARLGGMLPEHEAADRPALFAALIAMIVLLVYGDVQPVATAAPAPDAPLVIFGENEIALLSVQTEGTPGPSGSVAVEVEWQALRPLTRDYTVFFHVIAGSDQRFGQLDTMPQAGKLPTSQWQPGEVVRDRYEAKLSPDAPIAPDTIDDYRYWLGWYLGATGERLAAQQSGAAQPDDKYIVKP